MNHPEISSLTILMYPDLWEDHSGSNVETVHLCRKCTCLCKYSKGLCTSRQKTRGICLN